MIIAEAELFHIRLPYRQPLGTLYGDYVERDFVLLKLSSETDTAWGQAPSPAIPTFSAETPLTAMHILGDHMVPRLFGRNFGELTEVAQLLSAFSGNPYAKAAVESAFFHLFAAEQNASLSAAIGGTRSHVECIKILGTDLDTDGLVRELGAAMDVGFRHAKIKVGPGHDVDVVRTLRSTFPDLALTVDANGAYGRDDLERLCRLDDFGLATIEQPFASGDLVLHAELQSRMQTRIALDESVSSIHDLESAVALRACRALHLKPCRVGGVTAVMAIHDVCVAAGVDLAINTAWETTIAQADGLALASLPGFTLPAHMAPTDEYFTVDVVANPPRMTNGAIDVPTVAGSGLLVDEDLVRAMSLSTSRVCDAPRTLAD